MNLEKCDNCGYYLDEDKSMWCEACYSRDKKKVKHKGKEDDIDETCMD